MYTCVQYTVYRSIAELFKSDEDVKISTETEDVVGTEEVIIFQIKTPQHYTNYSLHTAVSLMLLVHVNIEELSESAELVEENFDEAFRHTDTAELIISRDWGRGNYVKQFSTQYKWTEDLYARCAGGSWRFHYKLETEDMTENDHELTIDDLESERKQD